MDFKTIPEVEVIEIYPHPKKLEGYIETGTCHIRIDGWHLEIANIPYLISDNKKIVVRDPGNVFKLNEKKIFHHTVCFPNNREVWQIISKKIKTEIKNLQPELFKNGKSKSRFR